MVSGMRFQELEDQQLEDRAKAAENCGFHGSEPLTWDRRQSAKMLEKKANPRHLSRPPHTPQNILTHWSEMEFPFLGCPPPETAEIRA